MKMLLLLLTGMLAANLLVFILGYNYGVYRAASMSYAKGRAELIQSVQQGARACLKRGRELTINATSSSGLSIICPNKEIQ